VSVLAYKLTSKQLDAMQIHKSIVMTL